MRVVDKWVSKSIHLSDAVSRMDGVGSGVDHVNSHDLMTALRNDVVFYPLLARNDRQDHFSLTRLVALSTGRVIFRTIMTFHSHQPRIPDLISQSLCTRSPSLSSHGESSPMGGDTPPSFQTQSKYPCNITNQATPVLLYHLYPYTSLSYQQRLWSLHT